MLPAPFRLHHWWAAAGTLVLAALGLRVWALSRSFFFADDYRLLLDAQGRGSTSAYLLQPFDAQFMPGGRLMALLVAEAGPTSWTTAAVLTLLWQLVAALACAWMLAIWFGARPASLALLALYLTSALTWPATMWWAASLNQLPLQVAFFVTVAATARYLRRPGWRTLLPVLLGILFGLLFYVKAVLLAPFLAALALGWFATGGPRTRVTGALREYWHAVLAGGCLLGGYVLFYVTTVPSAVEGTGTRATAAQVADAMLGTSVPVSLLGGPWRWFESTPPLALVGTPGWGVVLAQVVLGVLVLVTMVCRRRAWRGWALLAGYAFALYALLLVTRGQLFGGFAGLELRYLTDLAAVLPLAVGLVLLPVPGALESSETRVGPASSRWHVLTTTPVAMALVGVVAAGGVWSGATYALVWHESNEGAAWVRTVQEEVSRLAPVDLADRTVPANVVPSYAAPDDEASQLVPLIAPTATFPRTSDDLHVIGFGGAIGPAVLAPVATSDLRASDDCAVLLGGASPDRARVELAAVELPASDPDAGGLWLRLGYLAARGTDITVSVNNGDELRAAVRQGLHALWMETDLDVADIEAAEGPVTVDIGGLAVDTPLCLDDVVLGVPQAVP